jgi:hypothetical protein
VEDQVVRDLEFEDDAADRLVAFAVVVREHACVRLTGDLLRVISLEVCELRSVASHRL